MPDPTLQNPNPDIDTGSTSTGIVMSILLGLTLIAGFVVLAQ